MHIFARSALTRTEPKHITATVARSSKTPRTRLLAAKLTRKYAYLLHMDSIIYTGTALEVEPIWLLFDTCLVITGVLEALLTWVTDDADVGPVGVVRIARLLRTFRTVRLLRRFSVLWMMVRSFMDSLLAIAATMIFLLLVLYVFSCIGMQTITANQELRDTDPDFAAAVDLYFCDLPGTMLSLLQFVTMDSPSSIYRPLVKASPGLIIYFCAIILIVSIGLMNLVTAAIVSGAFEQAAKDKEVLKLRQDQEKKKVIRKFGKLFRRLDVDHSGYLSQDELLAMSETDHKEMTEVLGVVDPRMLFKELDTDNDGLVPLVEFCDVLWQESTSKVPQELRRVDARIALITKDMQKLDEIHMKITQDLVEQTKMIMASESLKFHGEDAPVTKLPAKSALAPTSCGDSEGEVDKSIGIEIGVKSEVKGAVIRGPLLGLKNGCDNPSARKPHAAEGDLDDQSSWTSTTRRPVTKPLTL
eukprot:TRINITY_DN4337_c0_g2_i1.p1 TRINITY_DN4337_c0_g2~~TRINITY_DN4337_c0_g2_i1.p1  ORF type:complete len:472 (-),score=65.96 TRINITY_DN4337_c0_g2_i1:189-1604(-)